MWGGDETHLMHLSNTSLTNLGLGFSRSTVKQSDLGEMNSSTALITPRLYTKHQGQQWKKKDLRKEK